MGEKIGDVRQGSRYNNELITPSKLEILVIQDAKSNLGWMIRSLATKPCQILSSLIQLFTQHVGGASRSHGIDSSQLAIRYEITVTIRPVSNVSS